MYPHQNLYLLLLKNLLVKEIIFKKVKTDVIPLAPAAAAAASAAVSFDVDAVSTP